MPKASELRIDDVRRRAVRTFGCLFVVVVVWLRSRLRLTWDGLDHARLFVEIQRSGGQKMRKPCKALLVIHSSGEFGTR